MRVLMLGWEYPPHISGGLGTACQGLSEGLAGVGVRLTFVVPYLFGDEKAAHMELVSPSVADSGIEIIRFPAHLVPYVSPEEYQKMIFRGGGSNAQAHRYAGDMFAEVFCYASRLAVLLKGRKFDCIHAHDWLTFPAALNLKEIFGVPLISHLHSLESDRSGKGANQRIQAIERLGVEAADQVVAVSHYTKASIEREYGVPAAKITVVHNGVSSPQEKAHSLISHKLLSDRKVVLFLGRITFQKGPDYLVEAAAKVVANVSDAVFVLAGSGDMLPRIKQQVRELGLGKYFYFPGFVKGEEIEKLFSSASVYVMPSVSEPFGISALEAINYDTPVIISKQSGVSEVLHHALKVDFWDVDRMSDLIINALIHPELGEAMASMAREEVKRLRWDVAARKVKELYEKLLKLFKRR